MEGFEKLANSLLAAKQVMNKVETGTYESGSIDPSALVQEAVNTPPPTQNTMGQPTNQRPVNQNMSEDKIRNSKLPDNIKQLMLENPIPTVDFNNDLPSGFIDEVAKKMEEQSQFGAGAQRIQKPQTGPTQNQIPTTNTTSLNEESLKDLIRETIKESVQEIVSEELQKLTEGTLSLKENLQIRVGNSVFVGKITDVRKGT